MNITQIGPNIYQVTDKIDLVYSEDDEMNTGKGWYFHHIPENKASQSFYSRKEAKVAFMANNIKWNQ